MFSQRLNRLTPYLPGEQPQNRSYIKLNTNENPYPPTPAVSDFLKDLADHPETLRLYPDPQSGRLKEAIARFYRLQANQIFVGNGSDEVLAFAFFSFFDSAKGKLRFPAETYSFYPVYCRFFDIEFETVPLNADFSVSVDRFLQSGKGPVILANPNAPTGIALPLSELRRLAEGLPPDTPLVIDEAYIDFGGESAVPLIDEFPNVTVIQTFSKSRSLAGLRLGFAIGNEARIAGLTRAKDSFNSYPVDRIAQHIGALAMEDRSSFESHVQAIIATREATASRLRQSGWQVLPSAANFIFAKHPYFSGEWLYRQLKAKGILVRWFSKPSLSDWLRISIGLPDEMEAFLAAVHALEAANPPAAVTAPTESHESELG